MYAVLTLLSALLFGLSTPLSKSLLSRCSPQQLAGLLYLGAALGVSIPILIGRKGFFAARVDRANAFRLFGAIFFGGVLGPLFLLIGLKLASASSVSLWLNLEMVMTSLLGAALFRDHLGRRGWLGAVCVLAAGSLLAWGEGAAGLKAGLCLGAACLCWGVDNNLTSLIDGLSPLQSTFWKGLVAGGFNLSLAFLAAHDAPAASAIPRALALGAISYGASIVLYITGAQGLGASRSQMLFASAPLFGLVASRLWLGDAFTASEGAAIAFQILGTVLLFKDRHGHPHEHRAMEHTHAHRHDDGHHNHAHPGMPASQRHSHRHVHEPLNHDHPHWPDLHHRHEHGS